MTVTESGGTVSGLVPQCILKWKNKGGKKRIRLCARQHGQKRRHTMAGDHRGVGLGGTEGQGQENED